MSQADEALEAKLEKAQHQLNRLQEEQDQLRLENEGLKKKLRKLEDQAKFSGDELARKEEQMQDLSKKLSKKDGQIKELAKKLQGKERQSTSEQRELRQTIEQLTRKLAHTKGNSAESKRSLMQRRATTIGTTQGRRAHCLESLTVEFPALESPHAADDIDVETAFSSPHSQIAAWQRIKDYESRLKQYEQDIPHLIDQIKRLEEEKQGQARHIEQLTEQVKEWKSLLSEMPSRLSMSTDKKLVGSSPTTAASAAGITNTIENEVIIHDRKHARSSGDGTLAQELCQTRDHKDVEAENSALREHHMSLENKLKVTERDLRALESEHSQLREYMTTIIERIMDSPFGLQAVLSRDFDPGEFEREILKCSQYILQQHNTTQKAVPLASPQIPMSWIGSRHTPATRSRGNTINSPSLPIRFGTVGRSANVSVPPSPRESISSGEGARLAGSESASPPFSGLGGALANDGAQDLAQQRRSSLQRTSHARRHTMANMSSQYQQHPRIASRPGAPTSQHGHQLASPGAHSETQTTSIHAAHFPTVQSRQPVSPLSSIIALHPRRRQPLPQAFTITAAAASDAAGHHEAATDQQQPGSARLFPLSPSDLSASMGGAEKQPRDGGDGVSAGAECDTLRSPPSNNRHWASNDDNTSWKRLSVGIKSWFN
ncbi:hypothetical protein EV182_000558 [Spiromyces aspiralis]|uniref:Uncharacterized protein n=1 Tax=Spiromyces aspiralis TaxID=68401 RepID=A0ACC1HU97_9FUNG|nr:hypothetical protein EV182_000558 [Spiromyces aspiralis]